jgi:hypothetical protein
VTSSVFIPASDNKRDRLLEQIYRSLLTFHDVVYVRSSAVQSDRLGDRVIAELHDAGLVRLLGLESDPPSLISASDLVLPAEVHLTIANSIAEAISTRPYVPSDGLPDPERASRVVERRVTLWNVGVAMHLAADLGHFAPHGIVTEQAIQTEGTHLGLQLDVSDLLFAVFRIASLSGLTVDELVTLRKQLPKVRKQIRQLMEGHARLSSDPAEREQSLVAIEESIYELQSQVLDSVARSRGVAGRLRLGAGLLLDVVGLFFYQLSIVGMFADLAEFLWDARKDRLVLYMHSISRAPALEPGEPVRLLRTGAPTELLQARPEHDNIVE